jgi:hypothetical protein
MEATLSEAKMAVEAVKLVWSEHHSNITIRHYECAREGTGPDLEFRAIMGVALARAYGAPVSYLRAAVDRCPIDLGCRRAGSASS